MTSALAIRDFAEFQPGDRASLTKTITEKDLEAFAAVSGDYNPLHMEAEFARETSFERRVVHGMLVGSYVSTLVGMHLPGPGALWTQQSFRWIAPVFIGDTLKIELTVTHKSEGTRTLALAVHARNQDAKTVMEGEGSVIVLETRKENQDRTIDQRLAFVSGGAGGIGAATARALANTGAAVAIGYHESADRAEEVCQTIASGGGRALALQVDVADIESAENAILRASDHFGQAVDILVNQGAAAFVTRPFGELTWDDISRQIDLDLRGAFHCSKAVLAGMLAQNSGRIVNIGATQAWNSPTPQWTTFVIAKAALNALTRSMAAELGPSGIRVNMVSPGMLAETDGRAAIPERLRKLQAMQTPLRRLALPEDVARAIVFLCSEGGEFITGADIPVCGGQAM